MGAPAVTYKCSTRPKLIRWRSSTKRCSEVDKDDFVIGPFIRGTLPILKLRSCPKRGGITAIVPRVPYSTPGQRLQQESVTPSVTNCDEKRYRLKTLEPPIRKFRRIVNYFCFRLDGLLEMATETRMLQFQMIHRPIDGCCYGTSCPFCRP